MYYFIYFYRFLFQLKFKFVLWENILECILIQTVSLTGLIIITWSETNWSRSTQLRRLSLYSEGFKQNSINITILSSIDQ